MSPSNKRNERHGPVAQLVEHRPFKAGVDGSNPSGLTNTRNLLVPGICVSRGIRTGALLANMTGVMFVVRVAYRTCCCPAGEELESIRAHTFSKFLFSKTQKDLPFGFFILHSIYTFITQT